MLPLRTKLWHDPLVQMWHQLAKMSGQSCGSEVTNLMVNSNKRADVVLYKGLYNVLTDVRTIAGSDPRYCCAAALSPGHGAAWGAVQKDAAWLAQARSQGDTFSPSATRWGGALASAARFFLTSSAPSLPRRQASVWLSGSMRFSDCMRPLSDGWPCSSTPVQ